MELFKTLAVGWIINAICYYIYNLGAVKRHGGSTGEAGMAMAWVALIGLVPYSLPVMFVISLPIMAYQFIKNKFFS